MGKVTIVFVKTNTCRSGEGGRLNHRNCNGDGGTNRNRPYLMICNLDVAGANSNWAQQAWAYEQ